jgi:hypothetical protein
MQKPLHFHGVALLFWDGGCRLLGSLLRYAAFGGYGRANDFSTSRPVTRCPFGYWRTGLLVEDTVGVKHIEGILALPATMVHKIADDRFCGIIEVQAGFLLLIHPGAKNGLKTGIEGV